MKPRFEDWPATARFIVLLLFFTACFLWGGGARLDIPGLVIVQPAAVIVIAAILIIPGPVRLDVVRVPLLLLLALALVMAVQLVPLPPALWTHLPGHAAFTDIATVAGVAQPWRPLSLTPDLTLSSLAGLVVPAATLLGIAAVTPEQSYRLLPCLLIAVALSTMLGLGQIAGGPQSGLYRYQITNYGAAVGFFSNRNHQAALLAMTFPMLALWVRSPIYDPRHREIRRWVAAAMAVFLVPMLMVTGSRGGLALAIVGLGLAWLQLRVRDGNGPGESRGRYAMLAKAVPVLAGILVLGIAILVSRAEALDRLFATPFSDDPRAQSTPVLIRMARDFFPVGSGFGSFDPLFRNYEPVNLLRETYLNHAHNDLTELVITGGLPAIVILLAFVAWAARRFAAVVRADASSRRENFARLGGAMIAIMLAGSLVDYPLRTPLMSAIFALACGWLAGLRGAHRQASDRPE